MDEEGIDSCLPMLPSEDFDGCLPVLPSAVNLVHWNLIITLFWCP